MTSIVGSCPACAAISGVYAQEFALPAPGQMVALSPAYSPAVLKGIKLDPKNPFRFHFYVDTGDSGLNVRAGHAVPLRSESEKLIKYFFTSLTIPEKDLWVNLSPYEKDRIVPQEFGQTEMGSDLLAEDYILKQITASLIYPESQLGKEFWIKVYAQAQAKYGTTNIPINTFNKVWIVPDKAVVYENNGTAFVLENHLKVMLEEDYLSMQKHAVSHLSGVNAIGSQIVREIIIPALIKEVNEGKNFAQLRQVFYSLILATWYKKKIRESILNKVYSDQKKINNLSSRNAFVGNPEYIYQQYLKAFKKGVYNYIKDTDALNGKIVPRKYFSGGLLLKVPMEYRSPAEISPIQRAGLDNAQLTDVLTDLGFNRSNPIGRTMTSNDDRNSMNMPVRETQEITLQKNEEESVAPDQLDPPNSVDLGDGYTLQLAWKYDPMKKEVFYEYYKNYPLGAFVGQLGLVWDWRTYAWRVNGRGHEIFSVEKGGIGRGKGLGRKAILALIDSFGVIESQGAHAPVTSADAQKMWIAVGAVERTLGGDMFNNPGEKTAFVLRRSDAAMIASFKRVRLPSGGPATIWTSLGKKQMADLDLGKNHTIEQDRAGDLSVTDKTPEDLGYKQNTSSLKMAEREMHYPILSVIIERARAVKLEGRTITVLDWGCGEGRMLTDIWSALKAEGIDNVRLVGFSGMYYPAWRSKSMPPVEIVWDDVKKLKDYFAPGSLDMVVSFLGLYHLRFETEYPRHMKELRGLLRNGGLIVHDDDGLNQYMKQYTGRLLRDILLGRIIERRLSAIGFENKVTEIRDADLLVVAKKVPRGPKSNSDRPVDTAMNAVVLTDQQKVVALRREVNGGQGAIYDIQPFSPQRDDWRMALVGQGDLRLRLNGKLTVNNKSNAPVELQYVSSTKGLVITDLPTGLHEITDVADGDVIVSSSVAPSPIVFEKLGHYYGLKKAIPVRSGTFFDLNLGVSSVRFFNQGRRAGVQNVSGDKNATISVSAGRQLDRAMQASADRTMSAKGGIDLDPARMIMQVKKDGQDFKFDFNGTEIDAAQVSGVTFTIRQMTPVNNLPQVLGLSS